MHYALRMDVKSMFHDAPEHVYYTLAVLTRHQLQLYPDDKDLRRALPWFIRRAKVHQLTPALRGKPEAGEI